MFSQKAMTEALLSPIGIAINGDQPWDMVVKDERLFARIFREKNLGLGEAYMDGWWDCKRLDEFFFRILTSSLENRVKGNFKLFLYGLFSVLFNLQSRMRSPIVAERHYNIDNDLFLSFLDPYNQYSCAYFDSTSDLTEAQRRKMELICRKLNLRADDSVLDIGCGWGGLARYMAETYGCRVTGINIATEQIRHAKETCRHLPVEILACDYRELRGDFDKIVSVGMFEHVGQKNYRIFMDVVHRCLKPEGVFLLHTIGGNDSTTYCDPWINRYIFPNGMLPSIAQIGRVVEGLFVLEDLHNLGLHYEKTLLAWHDNFQRSWDQVKAKHSERFKRMWEYYLLSCAGAFRARQIQLWQIVFTKYGAPQPVCR